MFLVVHLYSSFFMDTLDFFLRGKFIQKLLFLAIFTFAVILLTDTHTHTHTHIRKQHRLHNLHNFVSVVIKCTQCHQLYHALQSAVPILHLCTWANFIRITTDEDDSITVVCDKTRITILRGSVKYLTISLAVLRSARM